MKSPVPALKTRSFWGFLAFLAILWAWLARPAAVTEAAQGGLRLCAQVMIPSLFPFFVICNLFVRRCWHRYVSAVLRPAMGPLFGLRPEAAGALALGVAGGYPVGAAAAFRLYDQGQLNAGETARLLAFCNNAGPGFVFGVVGMGLLGSARAGAFLYAAHLAAALLVGVLAGVLAGPSAAAAPPAETAEPEEPFSISFVEAVRDGAAAMMNVCAFVVFFAVLLAFLRTSPVWERTAAALGRLGPGKAAADALLTGLLELSGGVDALRQSALPAAALPVCCGLLLGWGGLCVHCQTLSLRGRRSISMKPYFLGKLAQALFSALLAPLALRYPAAAAGGVLLLLLAGAAVKKTAGKTAADGV